MQAAHLVAKTKLGWKPQYDLAGGYEVGRLRTAGLSQLTNEKNKLWN